MSRRAPFSFDPIFKDGLRGHAARSAGLTLGTQVVKFALRMVSIAFLARLLSPGDYGLIAMATAITSVLGAIREAGLSSATIQRPKITQEQVSALFWLNGGMGFVIALLCCAVAPVASAIMGHEELILVIPAFGLIGIIGSFSVQHSALMQRRMEFKQLMLRDLAGQVAGVLAGVAAAKLGAGYWSLVVMEAATITISTTAIWTGCLWRPSRPRDFACAKPLVKFGASVTGSALITRFASSLDTIVLGYVFGSGTVGLYGRSQQLLSAPMGQVIGPVMSVARPALSRAAEDPQKLRRVTVELLGLISFCCAGLLAALIPVSDGVINFFLGTQWSAAVPLFIALSPFALVEPCAALLASVLVASGHPGALFRWKFVSLLISIPALFAGLPWGPVAAAAAYSSAGLLLRMPLFMRVVSMKTGIPFKVMVMTLIPGIIAFLISVSIASSLRVLFIAPQNPLPSIVIALTALVVYIGVSMTSLNGRRCMKQMHEMVFSMLKRRLGSQLKGEEHAAASKQVSTKRSTEIL